MTGAAGAPKRVLDTVRELCRSSSLALRRQDMPSQACQQLVRNSGEPGMIDLDEVRRAARRIEGRIRPTPLLAAAPMQSPLAQGFELVLKLECLQVTGSFKARGAISKLTSLSAAEVARGLVTASGGNHGAAVAYAGWVAGHAGHGLRAGRTWRRSRRRRSRAGAPGSRSRARSGTRATAPPWRSRASGADLRPPVRRPGGDGGAGHRRARDPRAGTGRSTRSWSRSAAAG